MTRRVRSLLIAFALFSVASVIFIVISAVNGSSLFAPDQRTMLGLALVCSLYVGLRGGILIERFFYRRAQGEDEINSGKPRRMFWKGNHAINHRMEERRKRVEEAKARASEKADDLS